MTRYSFKPCSQYNADADIDADIEADVDIDADADSGIETNPIPASVTASTSKDAACVKAAERQRQYCEPGFILPSREKQLYVSFSLKEIIP